MPALERVGGVDVLGRTGSPDVLLVAVGAMAELALQVADRLADQGIGVTVVDPRWVKPVDPALVALAGDHRLVVTVEDGLLAGGVGSALALAMRAAGVDTPLRDHGIPSRFLEHGTRAEVLTAIGLTAQDVSRSVVETIAGLDAVSDCDEHKRATSIDERGT
jgi:1-deoxy-D-xylulose-5-phosphate synthase